MKGILIMVPDRIKKQLDQKRKQGFTLNGWLNALLARELADSPTARRKTSRATS